MDGNVGLDFMKNQQLQLKRKFFRYSGMVCVNNLFSAGSG